MSANLTVAALLAEAIQRLRATSASLAAGTLDAEVLLAHALSTSRTQLKTHPQTIPSAERARRYGDLIERCASGEPVAYIIGYRDFWTLRLAVDPSVLVPRPETELLVERALALVSAPQASVADLGTGSGAIALALASERREWRITATDRSERALATARANAKSLSLAHVEFLPGNWFEPLAGRRFDLLVSNPPYIAAGDPALRHPALLREPQDALTPGPDGMSCLRTLIHLAPQYLERRGWLLLEHGSDQATAVARELVVRGFGHVRSHRDLAGHDRATEAQWN
ncbi:MAG TPA: peptide chain release factor N(5)-glutamine methyltransferase [Steroidobacteraceae bacterium]|nr:peptide chain release factor N(5)-glutamine methyltransferase [Steroidobacteraceae bacterium]